MTTRPADGFTAQTWSQVKTFSGRCAVRADVDAGAAVFALEDTENGQAFEEPLPQPVIWHDDEESLAAVIIQAESHETDDGEQLGVLGLLLPDGTTKVGFVDDVAEVDGANSDWLALIDAALDPDDADEDED
ncbi:MAG: hypothetical protein ACYDD1_12105 [Caulobacteraceae bacterium]